MTDDILTEPGPGSSSRIDWKTVYSHLLVIFPRSEEHNIQTMHGVAETVIRADIHDVDTGQLYGDVLIFPRQLVRQIRDTANTGTGKAILGKVSQGAPQPGKNPAWMLEKPSQGDYDRARAYLAALPPQANASAPPAQQAYTPPSVGQAAPAYTANPTGNPTGYPDPTAGPQGYPDPTAPPRPPHGEPVVLPPGLPGDPPF